MQSKSALRGRRIHNFIELWCLVDSGGLEILVSSTHFQKSNIDWPQQPPTERVLKFHMIFHDSTKTKLFSKYQSKAKFKNLDDSSDFRTSRCYFFKNWSLKLKFPNLLKPLGTIIQQNYWPFYPSEPFSFIYFNMIHPVD